MVHIFETITAEDLTEAAKLFTEYADSLEISLDFQNFDDELASLPGCYAPPEGCILLATWDDQIAGCVALRKLEDGICEMKRLFTRPDFRGKKIGVALSEAIIEKARQLGYERMRLDTLESMLQARTLYKSLGFREIAPYCYNPIEDAVFMELVLSSGGDNPS
jgi:ribosomal protein S18 acetylase RimI-like enzyme